MSSLREQNAVLNHEEFLAGATSLQSLPTVVFVELTENCNLSCKMCRSSRGYDKARDMPVELFEKIARALFPSALLIGLNGWGESTILRDFPDRLRLAVDSGARVRLVTNAHAMTPTLWDMFFEGENIVVVSFDSANPEMFAQLGRGNFALMQKNLEQGVKIRDARGRGTIYFNVVLNSYTLEELPDIVRFAADHGLNKVVVNPIKCPTEHPAHLSHSVEKIPRVLDAASTLARERQVSLQLGSTLDESLVVDGGLPDTCENPWSNVLIEYHGQVTFCHHLLRAHGYSVGSLHDTPFDQIWNGETFRNIRGLHVKAETTRQLPSQFQKCTWCYHNRYSDAELHTEELNGREVSTLTGRKLYELRPIGSGALR